MGDLGCMKTSLCIIIQFMYMISFKKKGWRPFSCQNSKYIFSWTENVVECIQELLRSLGFNLRRENVKGLSYVYV